MRARICVPPHTGCKNCGECCGMIPAPPEEVDQIREYLKEHPEAQALAIKQQHRLFDCPFRDNDNKRCVIYPVRPMICRLMGVCEGMRCPNGNSAHINGQPFLKGYDLQTVMILNNLDWQ